jgi:Transcriptional regulators
MNTLDQKLLNYIQDDGRLSIKKLSTLLFITAPAVSQRLKKLEEHGYIQSYKAILDLNKLSLTVKAFIQVELTPEEKPEFYKYIDQVPNVLECNCVSGPYSVLLKTVFPSTKELDEFVNSLQRFGGTNTQIVLSTPIESRGYKFD